MGKRVNRVHYTLDPKNITDLPFEEIRTILRGADGMILRAGRTMLAKVLKGSREKKLLELGLDQNPAYGFYRHCSIEAITAKIDWAILNGFLDLEYDHRLPLLVYTERGWAIEKDTYSDELLERLRQEALSGSFELVTTLKDRDRGLILLLLAKIEATGDRRFIPALEAWCKADYKKVQRAIRHVISTLQQAGDLPLPEEAPESQTRGNVIDLAAYRARKEARSATS
ncbi:RQC-minor-1 family DNA-binding protein [Hydrogenispora ethanolica]|jgi:superfamily II DNA helicase RecQ|nr:RQC-minor-1 family DNA-binding protein [Hydrogenispora ethanolica]